MDEVHHFKFMLHRHIAISPKLVTTPCQFGSATARVVYACEVHLSVWTNQMSISNLPNKSGQNARLSNLFLKSDFSISLNRSSGEIEKSWTVRQEKICIFFALTDCPSDSNFNRKFSSPLANLALGKQNTRVSLALELITGANPSSNPRFEPGSRMGGLCVATELSSPSGMTRMIGSVLFQRCP